ncbi:MAG TPA: precorrin-3B C(17)-methyltransferase [Stellaceae bacterium]|jgi:cobalt-precorrin 5A hydrolase/precorrin-3B C17-methyltransferase|nr:precorrin-3B C(17)-methyltransferase [Stellaceae bacterium]
MQSGDPKGIAIVVLGPSGAAIAARARALLPDARVHGPRAHSGDWDEIYDRATEHIAALFTAGTSIVGVCASGILIRAVAPLVTDKTVEPAVVALAEDGSVAVPLLGGHRGANAIARALADGLGGAAAITTAGDLRLGFALDEPPPGWRIANPERVKPFAAALLAGHPVALIEEACRADWLRSGAVEWSGTAELSILVTDRAVPETDALVFHPPVLALGIGCERGCEAEEIEALARGCLAEAGLAVGAVAAVVSVELKIDEPGLDALTAALDAQARFFSGERLLEETPRLTVRSDAAFGATGCWGVAEGAALAAAGADGALIVPRRQSRRATCAVARAAAPLDPETIGRPRGRLAVIGIGPGEAAWRTPEASALIAGSTDIVGYRRYLDLLGPALVGKTRHDGALGAETERVRLALDLAAAGRSVALVSSGDAGVYGLAALVFELLDREPRRDWRAAEIVVAPGVSAMHAAAARVGAPLGHDFCAISLSDLLTPWGAIRARLEAAADADFVIALYNPRSARRASQFAEALNILLAHRAPETPVLIARNIGRGGEEVRVVPLAALADQAESIDMLTLVIVGNSQTRRLDGDPPRLYTPRGYDAISRG